MAGRIRSIKPEVLDDEPMAQLSDGAWRLYVAAWVLADDHGRFRAGARLLAADVWQDTTKSEHAESCLLELRRKGFVRAYEVEGQRYAEIKPRAWKRHQRIDHPGKPRVPVPNDSDYIDAVSRKPSELLGDPRPSRARGGPPTSDLRSPTADHDARAEGEPTTATPVVPEAEAAARADHVASKPASESAFDLAKRVWQELWTERYSEPYEFAFDLSRNGDDRVLQRIGHLAEERASEASGAEAILRHKIGAYLDDGGRWVTENRHPVRGIEREWNKYGMPRAASSVTRIKKAKPAEPKPTEEELRLAAQRAKENLDRMRAMTSGLAAKKGFGS